MTKNVINHGIVISGGSISASQVAVGPGARVLRRPSPKTAPFGAPKLVAKRAGSGYTVSLTTADGLHSVAVLFTADQFAQALSHLIAVEGEEN